MASMGDAQRVGQGGLSKLTDGPRTTSDLSKVGGGLTRGPNQGKKLNAAAWSETWPAPQSTLDLDFANDRGWVRGVGQGKSMDAVTFTRASNGNYVKPDGTLSSHANQGALGNNLLPDTQAFDSGAWGKLTSATAIANTEIAPDGTLSADLLSFIANANSVIFRAIDETSNITISIFAKANTYNILRLQLSISNNGRYADFDLTNGTAGDVTIRGTGSTVTGGTSEIQNFGNGWYRCIIKDINAGGSSNLVITTNINAGDFFAWGAQLELGSTATEYFPTNIGQPRFDWASTEQVTGNLVSFSEDFDNAAWVKGDATINATNIEAPNGTFTADFLAENVTQNVFHFVRQTVSFLQTFYTFSCYAKKNGRNIRLRVRTSIITGTVLAEAGFNLDDGTVFGTPTGTALTEDVGNGWYRCSITFEGSTVGTYQAGVILIDDSGNTNYPTDITKGAYLWGAQLELGDATTTYKQTGAQIPSTIPLAANPTSNGLLIEESRTNRILWCRDATQANWTKTNVTAAKDQTGIDGVANAASSLTATANDGTCIQTITLASGSRTGSVYLKRITGTGNVQVSLDGSTYSTVELSASEWRRIVLSGTVTNPTVGIRLAVSGDAVAMDYGQVEDNFSALLSAVTSPILTTTVSVTRAADVATFSGIFFNQTILPNEGTIFCNCLTVLSPGFPAITLRSNATNAMQLSFGASTNGLGFTARTNNVEEVSFLANGSGTGFYKGAGVYKLNNFYAAFNKQTIGEAFSGQVPVINTMLIGANRSGLNALQLTINRITYLPKVISIPALEAITK
jgi:hypothetical protein